MSMRRGPASLLLLVLISAAPAMAQVQSRPADAPIVTADNDPWYIAREPIQFAGDVYYPAGAAVFFDGNKMVRSGNFDGVPLYSDTTIEPYSVVYVPVSRGLMQPYERLRQGNLAGTTGSRAPSFPVRVTATSSTPPSVLRPLYPFRSVTPARTARSERPGRRERRAYLGPSARRAWWPRRFARRSSGRPWSP
jgi:hypothetical protein